MPEMKPSVGRIVHFRTGDDRPCRAAVIVDVNEDTSTLDLYVFPSWSFSGGLMTAKQYGMDRDGDRWHWPERV